MSARLKNFKKHHFLNRKKQPIYPALYRQQVSWSKTFVFLRYFNFILDFNIYGSSIANFAHTEPCSPMHVDPSIEEERLKNQIHCSSDIGKCQSVFCLVLQNCFSQKC